MITKKNFPAIFVKGLDWFKDIECGLKGDFDGGATHLEYQLGFLNLEKNAS